MNLRRLSHLSISLGVLLCAVGIASAADFYVATNGINLPNRGTTPDEPFRSVTYALSIADTTAGRPHTIHVAAGTYASNTEFYSLPMIDSTRIAGAGPGETILDASGTNTSVITAVSADDWGLEDLTIMGGQEIQGGGVLATQGSGVTLRRLVIRDNAADYPVAPGLMGEGGGCYFYQVSGVSLENILFLDNRAVDNGGGFMCVGCSPSLTFITMAGNTCVNNPQSAAIHSEAPAGSPLQLTNSIIWGNPSFTGQALTVDGPVTVSYSVVERDDAQPWPGTGNVWDDPLFTDVSRTDFTLYTGSVAIDLADPSASFDQEPEPNGGRANSGAFGNTDQAATSGADYELRAFRWAFFGLPVDSPSGDPDTLFGDALGHIPPSDSTWRFQRWDSLLEMLIRYHEVEENGLDYGNPPTMEPGRGYLIREMLENRLALHVPGKALSQHDPVNVPLTTSGHLMYTMAANPFPYAVNLTDTRLQTPSGTLTFDQAADQGIANRWGYIMEPSGRFVPTLGSLDPWEGVVIAILGNGTSSWTVPPGRQAPASGSPTRNVTWALRANASALLDDNVVATDDGHMFGIGDTFQDGLDPNDALQLQFVRRPFEFHWMKPAGVLLFHDLQSADGGYYRVWHGEVLGDTTMPDTVAIEITGFNGGPSFYPDTSYGFSMIDEDGNVLESDLRDSASVVLRFATLEDGSKRAGFRIVVSHPDWLNDVDDKPDNALPTRFTVEAVYPNPFNAATSVVVNLPRPGTLKMTVYDVLGRQVQHLSWPHLAPGRQRIAWRAEGLASGVYFVRMEAAKQTVVKKVVLVR